MSYITFIQFFLVFYYVCIIAYKLEVPNKIKKLQKTPFLGRFFYELSQCEFCMENHLAFALAIWISYYFFDWSMLIYAPMSAALSQIIKRMSNERI